MDVEVKTRPTVRIAGLRHIGPYNQIGSTFGKLGQVLGPEAPAFFARGARMLAIFHDDPRQVPAAELRSDAAITIPDSLPIPAGLTAQDLAGGLYACALHIGPYEQLPDAWRRFTGDWLASSGHAARSGPSFELYLNDPSRMPSEELRTELYMPLGF